MTLDVLDLVRHEYADEPHRALRASAWAALAVCSLLSVAFVADKAS